MSVSQIAKHLNVSTSAIYYHLQDGSKDKANLNNKKYKAARHPLIGRVYEFRKYFIPPDKKPEIKITIWKSMMRRVTGFASSRGPKGRKRYGKALFTTKELLTKMEAAPFCYLTR